MNTKEPSLIYYLNIVGGLGGTDGFMPFQITLVPSELQTALPRIIYSDSISYNDDHFVKCA